MATNRFQRTRQDHKRERAEDYVELIAMLILENGQARAVDLADRLGVSHVSVSRTVQRLRREGLVVAEPYKAIQLTDAGARLAAASKDRHDLVYDFLVALGVSPATAESDTEGIEHHVSEETLRAMRNLIERSQSK